MRCDDEAQENYSQLFYEGAQRSEVVEGIIKGRNVFDKDGQRLVKHEDHLLAQAGDRGKKRMEKFFIKKGSDARSLGQLEKRIQRLAESRPSDSEQVAEQNRERCKAYMAAVKNPTLVAGDDPVLNQLYVENLDIFPQVCRSCEEPFTARSINKVLFCLYCWAHECANCARNLNTV